MKRTSVITLAALLLIAPALGLARKDRNDFAEGVTYFESDASPNATASNVNDYTYQDEQINIDPQDGVVKVLRTDQKILTNDFVTAIVQCKNVNPREIRGPIRTMVRKEGGEADVIQDKTGKLFYLHVVCPRFQLPFVEQAVAALDQTWVKERLDGSAELYYQAKFRDIRNIQNITRFYISPEGQGRFRFDDLNNAMYYTDQPALMGLQNKGLSEVDIPPNQVTLDVVVYEIDSNNDTLLGVDWAAWKNGPGRNLFEYNYYEAHGDYDYDFNGNHEGASYDTWYRNTSFNLTGASQYLDYVQNKGYVREMVKTSVTVKSGDPALVEGVDSVVHFQSVSAPDVRNEETITDEDGVEIDATTSADRRRVLRQREAGDKVGVRLELVPYIGLESMELDVRVDVSSVSGYAPSGAPILGARYHEDYVRLVDGESFVIGGIDRTGVVRQKSGMPWVHKLPGVGWLFGNENNAKRDTRLVILITPRFHLGTESIREMPEDAKTIIGQADGTIEAPIPDNPFGFDQWLLDRNK